MSYISTRIVKGKKYYYLEESFKFKNKLVKESVYFGSMYPSNDEIFLGEEVLKRTCLARNHTVFVPPLSEFIKNKTAKLLEKAKEEYLEKLNQLTQIQITQIKLNQFENLIKSLSNNEKKTISTKNLKNLIDYYNEGITKNEPLSEIKIKKIHSLLLETKENKLITTENKLGTKENKLEEYNPTQLHLLLTWYKEKNELIHQVEFAAKFSSKFYSLKLFKENNLILANILQNYILEQKGFLFLIIPNKKIKIYSEALEETKENENFQIITKLLIKETIKKSKIKLKINN